MRTRDFRRAQLEVRKIAGKQPSVLQAQPVADKTHTPIKRLAPKQRAILWVLLFLFIGVWLALLAALFIAWNSGLLMV